MREVGGEEYFTALMSAFSEARAAHIASAIISHYLKITPIQATMDEG